MTNSEKEKQSEQVASITPTKVSFLKTDNEIGEWQNLDIEPESETFSQEQGQAQKKSAAARKQLSEYLHSVLTTPNLVILAGSGTSLGRAGGPSMKDLWNKAAKLPNFQNVCTAVKHQSNDEWIENLLSRCRMAKEFFNGEKTNNEMISNFLSAAEKMIWADCSQFLEATDLSDHEIFFRRMARRRLRAPRLKLFTTNYDLCFEKAAGNLGIVVIDGFSFSQPRRFDARFFNYDVVRRATGSDESHDFVEGVVQILKLHGSVNWDKKKHEIIQNEKPEVPCLIYPTSTKYEQSYSQPHLEMMSQFQTTLREPNTCLITIGFGFNDNHLLAPVLAAINSNPSFKLLVIDPSAKSKSEQASEVYLTLREKIADGEADITMLNAEFGQFVKLIPHLRALSPAEQIERSVKQIARES